MISKSCSILQCPLHCVPNSNARLIEIIKQRLDKDLALFQMGFIGFRQLTYFHTESSRSFHFPALECFGENPQIAILGITKGTTQVEDSIKLLSSQLTDTNSLSVYDLEGLINETSIHSVFAGNQIRRNISLLFEKIKLWQLLEMEFNTSAPEKNIDAIIGNIYEKPNQYFYIASFIKCALFTNKGNSDAPSFEELLKLNGAIQCIENNFLPPFKKFKNLKILITFGKTSFDLVTKLSFNGTTLKQLLTNLGVAQIFLPHPSGANFRNINNYLNHKSELDWVTKSSEAYLILKRNLQQEMI